MMSDDLKILLAEDNPINQRVASFTFKQIKLKCDTALNGQIAFEMYKQTHYDLIFMDLQMPIVNGFESTKLIREFENSLGNQHRALIIALTGNIISDIKQEAIAAGMDDFIEKPITTDYIKHCVSKLTK